MPQESPGLALNLALGFRCREEATLSWRFQYTSGYANWNGGASADLTEFGVIADSPAIATDRLASARPHPRAGL
jgi:hypothetical protein